MKIKEKINTIRKNFLYKTIFASVFSLLTTIIFAIYNAYLGIKFGDAFAIGISIYYLLLVWVKSTTLIVEKNIAQKDESFKNNVRIKNYKISSMFIFIIDICLIAPIVLMVTQPEDVNFGMITSITIAVYSVYKIVSAIINYKRSKKSKNPTIILLREINIIDAILSILTLQHTLIMVNGGMNEEMQTLSFITSIAFIVLILIFSIISFCKNRKLIKL